MNLVLLFSLLPMATFFVLLWLEKQIPLQSAQRMSKDDWILSLSGFLVQGLIIPLLGYTLSTHLFPLLLPSLKACLPLGFFGAFLLNFIGVDFLYYWQHRAFHELPFLWPCHLTHHQTRVVNIWTTSRNSLISHFLFVYMLVNPVLGYLCDVPEGFFVGAMLTASLDLFRHTNIRVNIPILNQILMLPQEHHQHHNAHIKAGNYGANFILWDRLFQTISADKQVSSTTSVSTPSSLWIQLLLPWRLEA